MKIVVLVKRVGDTDAVAVDQALRIALRRPDVRIIAVTTGPVDAVRRALVLGADEGVHVLDDALTGGDALATSRVLAAATGRLGFDLVLCGATSASVVPAMVAERLRVAALCFADALTVRGDRVGIRRDDGGGLRAYETTLPAVVSVTARCGEPRYPRFGATVEARYKLVRTWSLADLGIDVAEVGAATVVLAVRPRTGGTARTVLVGDPTSAAIRLVDFLAERQFG